MKLRKEIYIWPIRFVPPVPGPLGAVVPQPPQPQFPPQPPQPPMQPMPPILARSRTNHGNPRIIMGFIMPIIMGFIFPQRAESLTIL